MMFSHVLALEGFLRELKAIRSISLTLAVSRDFCSRLMFPRFPLGFRIQRMSVSVPDFCPHGVPRFLFSISVPDLSSRFVLPITVPDLNLKKVLLLVHLAPAVAFTRPVVSLSRSATPVKNLCESR